MDIVYTVNREFAPFALVSLASVLKSNKKSGEFHVVHDGDLDLAYQHQMRRFVEQYSGRISIHRVPASFPREFSRHSTWDVSVLFRLALTEILPESTGQVLYLDSDTLVRRPLDELQSLGLSPYGLAAVAESHEATKRLELPPESAYLNSGVLLIDLDHWRQENIGGQMIERVMQAPDRWHFPDQDILATQFASGFVRLPPEYNVTHRFFFGSDRLPLPTEDPFVIHFSGQGLKPWQTYRHHPFGDEFWEVAELVRQSGFELPDRPRKPGRWYQRGPVAAYRSYRRRIRAQRRDDAKKERLARREVIRETGRQAVESYAAELKVLRGPFQGMRYRSAYAHGSTLPPKLLGTYEAELHPILRHLLSKDYRLVIDVGGAEGYYAIGCAMRLPDAQVIAYELGREARKALAEMAEHNGVANRIDIQAECIFGDLYGRRGLVICDIEGCEADLLIHDDAHRAFADSDFLIETHDVFRPGICGKLRQQFEATHHVTVIDSIEDDDRPTHWQLPELRGLSDQRQASVLAERRVGKMQWLVCESRKPFPTREIAREAA